MPKFWTYFIYRHADNFHTKNSFHLWISSNVTQLVQLSLLLLLTRVVILDQVIINATTSSPPHYFLSSLESLSDNFPIFTKLIWQPSPTLTWLMVKPTWSGEINSTVRPTHVNYATLISTLKSTCLNLTAVSLSPHANLAALSILPCVNFVVVLVLHWSFRYHENINKWQYSL